MARTIGMLGLGLLGSAIARRYLAAGHRVVGYDLSAPAREALAQAGGQAAESARGAAEASDVLVLSLPDSKVVAVVIAEVEPALRVGQWVIDTTTGDPADAAALGQRLFARGVHFLDATVAGSSAQVVDRQVIVMAGGNEAVVRSARELLLSFAREVFYTGTWGSGARMKLVVNLVLGLNRAVLAEGLALAQALELDPRIALTILKASPAYSTVMDTKGEKMLRGDFAPQARLSQHLKDVRLILSAAQQTGVPLPLSTVHQQLLERAAAAGYGEQDNSAILRAFDRGL
jgi:3-hydroxyisobutyrate dehydrogenase-like beta-hydroxyacid dehydrogenase